VRSALLYGLGLGASSAQTDADKFVLNAAHFQADAGRYGAAYRLVQVVLLPLQALVGATHVSFLQGRDAADPLRRAVRLSLCGLLYGVPAAALLLAIAPWVPKVLTQDFAGTSAILTLLAPVVVLRGVGAFPMNALLGLGRNGLRTRLLVGNALVSVALYAVLIPRHSWKGAVAATLVSESLLFASGWTALLCQPRPVRETQGVDAELAGRPVGSG
jgi:O-antigen/teichoic acid export membrane protein